MILIDDGQRFPDQETPIELSVVVTGLLPSRGAAYDTAAQVQKDMERYLRENHPTLQVLVSNVTCGDPNQSGD